MEIVKKISNEMSQVFRKVQQQLILIEKIIPLFETDSLYSSFWYLLIILVYISRLFTIPLDLSFGLEQNDYYESFWYASHELPLYIGILDIISSLNTAYYSKGVYVKERKKILKYYFKWSFWLDLFLVGPFLMTNFELTSSDIWHLNFFIVGFKIKIFGSKLADYFQFKDKYQGIIDLLKLIFMVFGMANLCGCAWNFLAKWENNKMNIQNTWLQNVKIENDKWQTKYVNSLYFSTVTMVTVGYGDISPQNSIEKGFAIIIIILSCRFFAYALNSVGIILKDMYREDDEFRFFLKKFHC